MSTDFWEERPLTDIYIDDFIRNIDVECGPLRRDIARNPLEEDNDSHTLINTLQKIAQDLRQAADDGVAITFLELARIASQNVSEEATLVSAFIKAAFTKSIALQLDHTYLIEAINTVNRNSGDRAARATADEKNCSLSQGYAKVLLDKLNEWDSRSDKREAPSDIYHKDLVRYLERKILTELSREGGVAPVGPTTIAGLLETTLQSVSKSMDIPYGGRVGGGASSN